jgi:hypothetical protein
MSEHISPHLRRVSSYPGSRDLPVKSANRPRGYICQIWIRLCVSMTLEIVNMHRSTPYRSMRAHKVWSGIGRGLRILLRPHVFSSIVWRNW